MSTWNRPLLIGALCCVGFTVILAALLRVEARPILGAHPALKPFKFAVSIALLLGSTGWLLPRIAVSERTRDVLAWVLLATMAVEIVPIFIQAARGTTSHFNVASRGDEVAWRLMQGAIVIATVDLIALAWVASTATLELSALDGFAWRAGLWLTLLSAMSGFRMGGASTHTIGGADGSRGWPLVNWSRTLGDLRVSHFLAVHALQVLPLAALAARWLPWPAARWLVVVGASLVMFAATVLTFVQALRGRPAW